MVYPSYTNIPIIAQTTDNHRPTPLVEQVAILQHPPLSIQQIYLVHKVFLFYVPNRNTLGKKQKRLIHRLFGAPTKDHLLSCLCSIALIKRSSNSCPSLRMSNSSKSDAPKSKASSKLNRSVKSSFITLGVGWCFNYHKDRGYLAKWGWRVHLLVVFAIFVVEFTAKINGGILHQRQLAVPIRSLKT